MDEPTANDTANPLPPLPSVPPIAPSTTADDPPPADKPQLIPASAAPPDKPKRKPAIRRENIRFGLIMPRQPSELSAYGSAQAEKLRRELEGATLTAHGVISPAHAGLILTACAWYRHFLHVSERMRRDYAELSPRDWLEFSRSAAHAGVERDRCVKALALDSRRSQTITLPPLPAPRQPYNANNYIPCDVAESNKK